MELSSAASSDPGTDVLRPMLQLRAGSLCLPEQAVLGTLSGEVATGRFGLENEVVCPTELPRRKTW